MSAKSLRHRRRWVWFITGATVVAAVAVTLALGAAADTTKDLPDADLNAIEALAVKYEHAEAISGVVPEDQSAVVDMRRRELAEAQADEMQLPVTSDATVLPLEAQRSIDEQYREALTRIATPEFVAARVDAAVAEGQGAGAMLNQQLANLSAEPLVSVDIAETGYVKCAGQLDTDYVVWVQLWVQDSTASGPIVECWPVIELRVRTDGDQWRIADSRTIMVCTDTDADKWGPNTPHQALDEGAYRADSLLHPGATVSSEEF